MDCTLRSARVRRIPASVGSAGARTVGSGLLVNNRSGPATFTRRRACERSEFLAEMLERDRLAALPRPGAYPETWSELLALTWLWPQIKALRYRLQLRRVLRSQ